MSNKLDEQTRLVENALLKHKAGNLQSAHDVYHSVLRQNPLHPQALHYLGLLAQQTGHRKEAAKLINKSISILPSDVRAYNHLGQIHISLRQLNRAKNILIKGIRIDGTHVDTLNTLANLYSEQGKTKEAIELYRTICKLDPKTPHSPYNLAQALKDIREFEQALKWFQKALALNPNNANASHSAGLTCEELGRFDDAVIHYENTLSIEKNHIRSLANLLAIRNYNPKPQLVMRAKELVNTKNVDLTDLAKMHNGLGKYHESIQDYERAFTHFQASCDAQQSTANPYNERLVSALTSKMIEAFSADFINHTKKWGHDSTEPIFIVGMPRSGTTLTEQIIASHPHVFGAGELLIMPKLCRSIMGNDYSQLDTLTQQSTYGTAQNYLTHIKDLQKDNQKNMQFITDKLPMNFLYIGCIITLFPNAKIIHCTRQPYDIGLSCFIEIFKIDNDFTTNFSNFAHYFLEYKRLMEHWNNMFPQKIHQLKYEHLVANQEAETQKLLDYIGLGFHENCLDFHKTERAINTPSRWQVRQPIYKTSTARWKNYESHIQPLIDALEGYEYG